MKTFLLVAIEDVLIEGAEGTGDVWREVICRLREASQVDTKGLYDSKFYLALASQVLIEYLGPPETSYLKQAAILVIICKQLQPRHDIETNQGL